MKYIIFVVCLLFVLQVQACCSRLWSWCRKPKSSRHGHVAIGEESRHSEDSLGDSISLTVNSVPRQSSRQRKRKSNDLTRKDFGTLQYQSITVEDVLVEEEVAAESEGSQRQPASSITRQPKVSMNQVVDDDEVEEQSEIVNDNESLEQPSLVVRATKKNQSSKTSGKFSSVLQDENNDIEDAPVEGMDIEEDGSSQEQLTLLKDNQFEVWIKNKEYGKIMERGKNMTNEDLVRQLFPVITDVKHYNGLKEFLKRRKMVTDFYLNGNMEVVKRIIAENPEYDTERLYL